jgi:hypothetical protein
MGMAQKPRPLPIMGPLPPGPVPSNLGMLITSYFFFSSLLILSSIRFICS